MQMLFLVGLLTFISMFTHETQSVNISVGSEHSRHYYVGEPQMEYRCYEWDVKCDPDHHQMACCRWTNFYATKIKLKTVCEEGWLPDDNGNCSIEACLSNCTHNEYCASDGNCTSSMCYPGKSFNGGCECPHGFIPRSIACVVNATFPPPLLHIVNMKVTTEYHSNGQVKYRNEAFQRQNDIWTNTDYFNLTKISFEYYISWKHLPSTGDKSTVFPLHVYTVRLDAHRCSMSATMTCQDLSPDLKNDYGNCSAIFNISQACPRTPGTKYNLTISNSIQRLYAGMVQLDNSKPIVQNVQFSVSPELQKRIAPITVRWNDWTDDYSGIWQYKLMVFKLFLNKINQLQMPPTPVSIQNINASKTMIEENLRGKESDVYAFLLGVEDYASNIQFARRFVIFDPCSDVSTTKTPMFVQSATKESNYTWQSHGNYIHAVWKNHFQNHVHKFSGLLNDINPSPYPASNYFVPPVFDDMSGQRMLNGIHNWNGIVKFEYLYSSGNTYIENSNFQNISSEEVNITITNDFKMCTIWVRGYDIMGRSLEDRVTVYIDKSNPLWDTRSGDTVTWLKNIPGQSDLLFKTRVTIKALDRESGINQIRWYIINESNELEVFASGSDTGPYAQTDCLEISDSCYKSSDDKYYFKNKTFYIDHCKINFNNTENLRVKLKIVVYNAAMLSIKKIVEIGNLKDFKGIEKYHPVVNLRKSFSSASAVTLSWEYPISCKPWKALLILNKNPELDGKFDSTPPPDKTWLDLTNLSPSHQYSFEFTLIYDGHNKSLAFSFVTDSAVPAKVYKILFICIAVVNVLLTILGVSKCLFKKFNGRHMITDKPILLENNLSKSANINLKSKANTNLSSQIKPQKTILKLEDDEPKESDDHEDNVYEALPQPEYECNEMFEEVEQDESHYAQDEYYSNE